MPGDHILEKRSLLRETLLYVGALLIGGSLLLGTTPASGHSSVKPADSASPTPGSLVTETYEFTGEPESFMVPTGVEAISVTALGAAGGYGGVYIEPFRSFPTVVVSGLGATASLVAPPEGSFASGGTGGEVQASLPVTAGQTLTVNVGGVGATSETPQSRSGNPSSEPLTASTPSAAVGSGGVSGAPGGYNGGGESGGSEYFYRAGRTLLYFGGGGGGASTVSLAAMPLIVAGGGGGGGANYGERRAQNGVLRGAIGLPDDNGQGDTATAGGQVVVAPPTSPPSNGGAGGGSSAQSGDGESGSAGPAAGGAGGGEGVAGSMREVGGKGEGDGSAIDPDDEGGFTGGGGGGGYYGGLGGSFEICPEESCEGHGAGGGGGGSDYADPSAHQVFLTRGAGSVGEAGSVTLSYFAPYPTTTEAVPNPSTAATGETVTITGTVTAPITCGGTIEFQLDGTPTGAPIPVSSNTAQTTITAPPPGTHEVTAIYSGSPSTATAAGCLASTSSPSTLTTTISYPTTTEATPTPARSSTGETVTLTGTVTAPVTCGGTIEFQLDGTPTGAPIPVSSNTAQTTITAPPPGSHKIIAIYSGSLPTVTIPGCLPSQSEPTTLTTTEPLPTTTTATANPSKASTGETVTLTGTVKANGPCAGTIEFQLDGTPTGAPIPVSSNTAQTTITAPPPGSHKIIAIYSGAPTTTTTPGCLPSNSEPTTLTTTEPYPTITTATANPPKASTGETVTLTGTVTAPVTCGGTIEFQLDGTPTGAPVPVSSNTAQTTITAPPPGSHKIIAIYSGAPTTTTTPGCLPSNSEPTTLTTTAPLTNAEGLVPIKDPVACQSTRQFTIHLQLPRRLRLLGAAVYIDGKLVKRLGKDSRLYRLNLRKRPYATVTIKLSAQEPDGHTVTGLRIYHTCRAHKLPAHTKFKI